MTATRRNGAPPSAGQRARTRRVKSLDHAVDILHIISEHPRLGVSQIARRAGLSKSAAFDILATLESRQLIQRDASQPTYSLGPALNALTRAATPPLHQLVRPTLHALARRAHISSFFGILASDHAVYITSIPCPAGGPPRLAQLELSAPAPSRPLPLHATAGGKVLLAYQREAVISRIVRRARPFTPYTVTAPTALTTQLHTIRRQAFATCWEEHHLGVSAISIPIHGDGGSIIAAVTISGPPSRISPRDTPRLLTLLRRSARDIELQLRSTPRHALSIVPHATAAGSS